MFAKSEVDSADNLAEFPDWAAMRAAGIPATSGKRLAEQMEFDGVQVSE